MITRIAEIAGGALLMGALALGGHASQSAPAAPLASRDTGEQCSDWSARLAAAQERLHESYERAVLRTERGAERAVWRAQRAFGTAQNMMSAARNAFAASQEVLEEGAGKARAAADGPGWLGVHIDEVTPDKARELKLPTERGALVTVVEEGSPAAKAGMKGGDVITDFDGQRVQGTSALRRMIREVPAGRSVPVTVWRDGRSQSLTVVLGSPRMGRRDSRPDIFVYKLPDDGYGMRDFNIEIPDVPEIPEIAPLPAIPPMPNIRIGGFRAFGAPALGVDAEDLSGQLGNYFGAPDGEGVLVREVMPSTPAEKAGLKAGDVITKVDGKRVRSTEELREKLRDRVGDLRSDDSDSNDSAQKVEKSASVTLSILRKGAEMSLRVELQLPGRRVKLARRVFV